MEGKKSCWSIFCLICLITCMLGLILLVKDLYLTTFQYLICMIMIFALSVQFIDYLLIRED